MDSVLSSNAPGESKGREARFRTLIFWVYEPMETLKPRLDRRVDKMLEVCFVSFAYHRCDADFMTEWIAQ